MVDQINQYSWADWYLDKLEIDFEKIIVYISDINDKPLRICCIDYIGFTYIGHWDESVIEEIIVESNGSLIDDALNTVKNLYGEDPLPGGGVKKTQDKWYQLNIKLIDGNLIKIACKSVRIEKDSQVN